MYYMGNILNPNYIELVQAEALHNIQLSFPKNPWKQKKMYSN